MLVYHWSSRQADRQDYSRSNKQMKGAENEIKLKKNSFKLSYKIYLNKNIKCSNDLYKVVNKQKRSQLEGFSVFHDFSYRVNQKKVQD